MANGRHPDGGAYIALNFNPRTPHQPLPDRLDYHQPLQPWPPPDHVGSSPSQRPRPDGRYITLNFLHQPANHQPLPQLADHQPLPQLADHQPLPPHQKVSSPSRSLHGARVKRCCCSLLEIILLLPIILFVCGLSLLPSAVYFVPRDLLVNTEYKNTSTEPLNNILFDPGDLEQNCSQGFLDTVGNACVPSCKEFLLDDGVNGISIYRVVVIAAGALSCITALIFMVLALIVSSLRKAVFSFPKIYSLYMCITSVVIAVVILVGAVRGDLFCSADDFTIANETTYCTISGVLFSYTSLQLMLWTAFLAVTLLWAATCPRSYASSKKAGHLKLLHFLSVTVAVVVPIVTALIQLEVGFQRVGAPPIVCLGRNKSYVYYALSLTLSVVGVVPSAGLVIVGWIFIKNCCKSTDMTCVAKFKTITLLLYALTAGWSVTCFLFYFFVYDDIMSQELTNRFTCESGGPDDCPSSLTQHLDIFQIVLTTSVVLLMLMPLVVLILMCDQCCCCRQKDSKDSEGAHSTSTSPVR